MFVRVICLLLLLGASSFAPAAHALTFSYTGNIASGAQFDLYPIFLNARDEVTATLVCDATATLDPVLSVFLPGAPTADTNTAYVYNDDGGTESCGGFRSSRINFIAPVSGIYNFRADGFGSSTGGYTLAGTASTQVIPTLGEWGLLLLAVALAIGAWFGLRRKPATTT